MNASGWVALATGIIAGLVALAGYLLNQLTSRNERKSKVYAEAITAVYEYQELPYRIRRRTASDQAAIADKVDTVLTKLAFHVAWLQLDSREVGAAYSGLVSQTGRQGGPYRAEAWSKPLAASDQDFHVKESYSYDNQPERQLCLLAMRRELRARNLFLRRSTRRLLAQRRSIREREKVKSPIGRELPEFQLPEELKRAVKEYVSLRDKERETLRGELGLTDEQRLWDRGA